MCLKLFDDRFQLLEEPNLEEESDAEVFGESDERLPRWFDRVVSAEWYALNEASAYEKLRPVQGSIVPWFYGTHQVDPSYPIPPRDFPCTHALLVVHSTRWNGSIRPFDGIH